MSNRAETQRFWGLGKSAAIERQLGWSALGRACGPAFVAEFCQKCGHVHHQLRRDALVVPARLPAGAQVALVVILVWPLREVAVFAGNVVAITQQSLWGRVLNYVEEGGGRNANYRAIVGEACRKEGLSAFFTPPNGSRACS